VRENGKIRGRNGHNRPNESIAEMWRSMSGALEIVRRMAVPRNLKSFN